MKKTMLCSPMKHNNGILGTCKVSKTPARPQRIKVAFTTAIKALPVKRFWLMLYVPGVTIPNTTNAATISHEAAITC